MALTLKRWGGPASLAAAVIWIMVWWHQRLAHGRTQDNEMNLVWGLTWMDSGKFLVLALGLVLVGLASLYQRREQPGPFGRAAGRLTLIMLGVLMVAAALEFWSFPWGSYAVTFEDATGLVGSNLSGALQFLVSLLFTLCLIALMVDLVRAKVVSIWVALVLILGGLTTLYLSPVLWLPAVAWLVLGLVVWPRNAQPAP